METKTIISEFNIWPTNSEKYDDSNLSFGGEEAALVQDIDFQSDLLPCSRPFHWNHLTITKKASETEKGIAERKKFIVRNVTFIYIFH